MSLCDRVHVGPVESHASSRGRALQKKKHLRKLRPEEVKVLMDTGVELDLPEYQRLVEVKEVERRKEREEKMAREALKTLEALEREDQRQALAVAAGEGRITEDGSGQ